MQSTSTKHSTTIDSGSTFQTIIYSEIRAAGRNVRCVCSIHDGDVSFGGLFVADSCHLSQMCAIWCVYYFCLCKGGCSTLDSGKNTRFVTEKLKRRMLCTHREPAPLYAWTIPIQGGQGLVSKGPRQGFSLPPPGPDEKPYSIQSSVVPYPTPTSSLYKERAVSA